METKVKIQIKSVFGKVLFEYEKEDNTIKDTLVEAVKGDAYLSDADLGGADLRGANLRGAYLSDADLGGRRIPRRIQRTLRGQEDCLHLYPRLCQ